MAIFLAHDVESNACVKVREPTHRVSRNTAGVPAAYSIFHESWWLNITAGGMWDVARSFKNGRLVGEMPYCLSRVGLWYVSGQPPLTRTLGPIIMPINAKPAEEFRNRLSVTYDLIDQLPDLQRFHQILDPRTTDALAFQIREFEITNSYTFQIPPDRSTDSVWSGMRHQTRNLIRSASAKLSLKVIDDPLEFLRFYETSQFERGRRNVYGRELMMQLTQAFLGRRVGRLLGAYTASGQLVAAVAVVWDSHAMYYLLSSRSKSAHSGSISLLIWTAIQDAIARGVTFDFDGIASSSILQFLSGFGGNLVQRISVERLRPTYIAARQLKYASVYLCQSVKGVVGSG
jgi:hypothetical protein